MKKLGDFLKQKREERNMTIDTISSKMNVKNDYVSFLEEGQIYYFSEERLNQIVTSYNLNKGEEEEFYKIVHNHK